MILGLMLTVILLPFAGGMLLQIIKFKNKRNKVLYFFVCTRQYIIDVCVAITWPDRIDSRD